MEQVMYLDIFFSINFLLDLLIIMIVAKLLVQPIKVIRVFASGTVGALYACIVVVFPIHNAILNFVITYVLVGAVMLTIAFNPSGLREKIKAFIIFYATAFILNGAIDTVSALISNQIVIFILAIFVTILVIVTLASNNKSRKDKCVVKVSFKGKTIVVTALVDTGNSLTEPISRKPVSIIEAEEIKKLLGGAIADEKIRMIPFNSIGKQGGIIPGIQVDSMMINQNGSIIEVKDSIIGVYNKKLSSTNEYRMLLNPKIMENKVKSHLC